MLRELGRAVRSQNVRAVELLERSYERIEAADPQLHAIVALRRPEEALEEAAAIDAGVEAGKEAGPLAGIPCLIKDIEDMSGLPTTHGSRLFGHDGKAIRDGLMASLLRGAGAIPMGKASTSAWA